MREDELDFRLLFKSSPDVLLVLLPDPPRYTMVAATEARFRATHTDAHTLGRGLFELFPDNPDDPGATGTSNLRASLDRVVATKTADTMAVQKYDIRGPDGSFQAKYWSPKNIPVLSPAGHLQYILHRVEDVTDLVQASELGEELRDRTRQMEREILSRSRELARANHDLRDANLKLGQLDTAKTAFFSNVSHEFRTPLTLILGHAERALAAPNGSLAGEELAALHRNSLRLLRLVNSLLDFSRIESGGLHITYAPTDLATLTSGVAGAFQSLFQDAGLRLTVECSSLPEPVYVDAAQWEKVLMNLLSNAFKFTFEGEIGVRLSWQDDHAELAVSDTGTGIPESELPRIFERFHRVEGARGRSFEGTGIGLALVHELVRLHGGQVEVDSELGRGTTFVVKLPRGSGHLPHGRVVEASAFAMPTDGLVAAQVLEAKQWMRAGVAAQATHAPASADEAREQPQPVIEALPGRLIVADDNADMREYLRRLLSPHWEVRLVADGRAALEQALAEPPDLVLSDVMMPEMDGIALLNALRADERTRTVPVILISARAGEEARLSGLETGADDYLVKPFAAREVLTRIRTHLEMAKVRRAAAEAARELAETRAAMVSEVSAKHQVLQASHAELKRTQSQLVQAAKMASLGELVAGIAHEINNPLAFALAHLGTVGRSLRTVHEVLGSEMVEAARRPWERALARVHEMHLGLERIQELVSKLRTFSRLDEGERKRVSARESIESVLTILGHRIGDHVSVTTEFGEPDAIECFAGLFNQAVMNLVANAIDAIDATGGPGTIAISCGARGNFFEVLVADSGCGIPEAVRERVFEPFFTTKDVGHGTGLGLSITYSIAEAHGGSVDVMPRDGGGTLAFLRLPLRGPSVPPGHASVIPPPRGSVPPAVH
jgi:signal transduction histidine kinase